MKKFERHRTYAEIVQACREQGLTLNDFLYCTKGWDTIVVESGGCKVIYNTFNGKFFGTTPDGTEFDSSSIDHEGEAWFQGLLAFFMVEGEEDTMAA